jgi:head-tail adaptor
MDELTTLLELQSPTLGTANALGEQAIAWKNRGRVWAKLEGGGTAATIDGGRAANVHSVVADLWVRNDVGINWRAFIRNGPHRGKYLYFESVISTSPGQSISHYAGRISEVAE